METPRIRALTAQTNTRQPCCVRPMVLARTGGSVEASHLVECARCGVRWETELRAHTKVELTATWLRAEQQPAEPGLAGGGGRPARRLVGSGQSFP